MFLAPIDVMFVPFRLPLNILFLWYYYLPPDPFVDLNRYHVIPRFASGHVRVPRNCNTVIDNYVKIQILSVVSALSRQ